MKGYKTEGNASLGSFAQLVTHGMDGTISVGFRACETCGKQFRPKRSWQKQCSARCRQRAYIQRRPLPTLFYYGA